MALHSGDIGAEVAHSLSQASMVSDQGAVSLSKSFERSSAGNSSFSRQKGEKTLLKDNVDKNETEDADTAGIPLSVWVMYAVSAICQCAQTLTEFIAWFVIKSRGWAKDQNPAFYGLTYAISSFVPVVMNPILGWVSHTTSIRVAMIGALTISIAGMLTMVYAFEPVYYALGYFLYSTAAIRPLRTAYIAQATEAAVRTKAMAYLNLWTDGAKMMGLLSAKIWDRLAPDASYASPAWTFFNLQLERLTLSLFSSVALFLLAILTLMFFFREQHPQHANAAPSAKAAIQYTQQVSVIAPDGTVRECNGEVHVSMVLAMFCIIFLLHQSSCGSVSVSNLPVLTEWFQQDEDQAATIKLAQDLLGMPTPLLVAWLSKYLSDRVLFVCGILLAWAAIFLFGCPPGVSVYQPLVGMGVGHASQTFFFTAGFSMLSKVLGVRSNGTRMALVASFAALGSTVGSLFGGRFTLTVYGTWWFFLRLIPSGLGLMLLLLPPFWNRMDTEDYITKQLMESWARDASEKVPLKAADP